MKGKITDMVQNVKPEYWKEIDLTQEEMDALTKDLNMERVKEIALEKASATETAAENRISADGKANIGASSLELKHKKSKRDRKIPRWLIPAVAAAVICLGGTAFAAQMGYFDLVYGPGSKAPEDKIIKIHESIADQGIIMTLEEILPGDGGGIILMSFERENGEAFPEVTQIANVELQILNPDGDDGESKFPSLGYGFTLIEDGKKLIANFSLDGGEQIIGKDIQITAETLFSIHYDELAAAFTLEDYFAVHGNILSLEEALAVEEAMEEELSEKRRQDLKDDRDSDTSEAVVSSESGGAFIIDPAAMKLWAENRSNSLNTGYTGEESSGKQFLLPLENRWPEYTFGGMVLVDDMLLLFDYNQDNGMDNYKLRDGVTMYSLIDDRTGEEIFYSGSKGNAAYFRGITKEDLPYLRPVVSYSMKEIVSEGVWSFSCFVEDKGQVKIYTLDIDVPTEDGMTKLIQVVITPMGINFTGVWPDSEEPKGVPRYRPEVQLCLSDGTFATMEDMGGRSESIYGFNDGFKIRYDPASEDPYGVRFLDSDILDNVKSLIIDGREYDLQ